MFSAYVYLINYLIQKLFVPQIEIKDPDDANTKSATITFYSFSDGYLNFSSFGEIYVLTLSIDENIQFRRDL